MTQRRGFHWTPSVTLKTLPASLSKTIISLAVRNAIYYGVPNRNDIIVLDRDAGKVFRVTDGVQSKPLLDVNVETVGYRGLLGVAVSADEKTIQNVFLYYTQARKRDSEDVGAFLIQ